MKKIKLELIKTENMKKIKIVFGILFISIMSMFIIQSCEEAPPPIPACERDGTGTVKIKNTTGYGLWVDCTYTRNGINYEKKLSNGSSYTYTMDKGNVYIHASFDGQTWTAPATHYLTACESFTYTWYLDKKKSTERSLYLIVTDDDGNIVDTIEGMEVTRIKNNESN